MAAAAAAAEMDGDAGAEPAPAGRGSTVKLVGALALLTVLAVGTGGVLGIQLASSVGDAAKKKIDSQLAAPLSSPYQDTVHLRQLAPIVTNVASPANVWIRLEASLVLDDTAVKDADLLAAEITEDLLAYLRTVSLAHVEGPSGFQHLRDDLDERVAIRSEGRVKELVVSTLVVQ